MTGTIIVGDGGEVDDGNETTDGGNETTNGGNETTDGGNETTDGGNETTNGGNETTDGGNETTNGGNETTNGGNETTTNNTTTGNAHCLILDNATMNQTHYITVDLVNTCSDAIMYPGINATSDSSEVTGLYDIWWYVIGDNSTIQMGWQLSINETVENGSVITLYFEAFILNCGPENSWNDDCPNSNIYYPFTVFNNNTDGNETTSNVTHYIDISGMSFNPGTITINVGDTIIWTNNESSMPHTVTADNGNFDSGTLNSGDTFTFTFTEAGTYTYHCAFHSGMTATIIVE